MRRLLLSLATLFLSLSLQAQTDSIKPDLETAYDIYLKFQHLDSSMNVLTKESQSNSESILADIQRKVNERGNKDDETKALNEAEELNLKSTELIKKIEVYKKELIQLTGEYSNDEGSINSSNNNSVNLQEALNEYIKTLNSTSHIVDSTMKKQEIYFLNQIKQIRQHTDSLIAKIENYKFELISQSSFEVNTTSELMIGIGNSHKLPDYAKYKTTDSLAYAWSLQTEFNDLLKELNLNYYQIDSLTNEYPEKEYFSQKLAIKSNDFDHTTMITALAFLTEKQAKLVQYDGELLAKYNRFFAKKTK
jgi:hypothetical protein